MFCKKDVLRNFAKFTGKHLCQRLFLNKVAGLRHSTLLKKRPWHRRRQITNVEGYNSQPKKSFSIVIIKQEIQIISYFNCGQMDNAHSVIDGRE